MSTAALEVIRPRHGGGDDGGMGMFELLRDWDRFLDASGRATERTRALYRYALLRFVADTLLDLREVREQSVVDYLIGLPAQGHMRGDVLRALKSFYRWAEEREILLPNPVKHLRIPRPKLTRAPILEDEHLVRLLIALAWRDPRRAWGVLFIYGTGARITQACAVREEDVREGRVFFRVTKGDRPYDIPLEGIAAVAFEELRRAPRPHNNPSSRWHGCLLGVGPPAVRAWLRAACHDAELSRVWPHLLRHTFATRAYALTKSPVLVAQLLNHADLSQIPRYVGVAEEEKRAVLRSL
ncbi:MAG TPA: tyrosine-type recombinase/integrase [Actinomycetota bacterium]|nr:tyrosine-type recombinase/integrase [Actinomycetota bacterium]